MYVIFPADQLIYMTYGAVVPRLQRRPTLDYLREPLVPLDKPVPSSNPPTTTSNISSSPSHLQRSNAISSTPPKDRESLNSDVEGIINYETPIQYRNAHIEPQQLTTASSTKSQASSSTTKSPFLSKPRWIGKKAAAPAEQKNEKSRVSEDHKISIENPTFTRNNLSARNYDAFFESGEPVYSMLKFEPPRESTPQPQFLIQAPDFNTGTGNPSTTKTRNTVPLTNDSILKALGPKSPRAADWKPKSVEFYSSATELSHQKDNQDTSNKSGLFGWRRRAAAKKEKAKMAAAATATLKDFHHVSYTETIKNHNGTTFKLVKTISDFTETLSQLYEQHASELQTLLSNYRKKNSELRRERPACHSSLYHAWEIFLQEVEADSQSTTELATLLSKQVARPLLERSFHRKVQSRKIFDQRESFDTIIAKTEDKLTKCRADYKQCYLAHRNNPTQQALNKYINSHNAYVQQLHATNAMLEFYRLDTVPQLLLELEEIYTDLCNIVAETIMHSAEYVSSKATEHAKRYDELANICKSISGKQDLTNMARVLPISPSVIKIPKKPFMTPQSPNGEDGPGGDMNDTTPIFGNELIIERNEATQPEQSLDSLRREAQDLEIQIRTIQDSIDNLARTQSRGLDSQLYNKANEIQEDISMKKFDLRAHQIHLAAVRAQKALYLGGKSDQDASPSNQKLSSSSATSMKTKWLKAFRSLKPASGPSPASEKKNGAAAATALAQIRAGDTESHNLQEYTYKRITPCDICGQVLRGHTRQGLRCRICKTNVHTSCASKLQRCHAKQKLLRRQKSTSEIENQNEPEEEREGPSLLSRQLSREPCDLEAIEADKTYQILKQAGEISSKPSSNDKVVGMVDEKQQQQQQPPLECPSINEPTECLGGDRSMPARRKQSKLPGKTNKKQTRKQSAPHEENLSSSENDHTIRPFGQPLCLLAEGSTLPPIKSPRKHKS